MSEEKQPDTDIATASEAVTPVEEVPKDDAAPVPVNPVKGEDHGEVDKDDDQILLPPWSEADDSALLLFIEDAKKAKQTDSDAELDADLLDDVHAAAWDDIAARFSDKTAINCLQRYARMKLREMQNMYLGTAAPGDAAMDTSDGAATGDADAAATSEELKRPAEKGTGPDAKRVKVTDESLAQWTEEETEMLREMVTQFPNSKFMNYCIAMMVYQ
jgi:hypothetical protein